jgi:pyruvate/2-oxoglutarate/acetoin dehydrogenase E1 component
MKKLIIGALAVGAVLALRPAVKRRMVQKMQQHCKQMMAQFAGRRETTGDEAMGPEAVRQKMREHCEQMAAQHEERSEPVATP